MNIRWAQDAFAYYNPYYQQYEGFYDGDHPCLLSDSTRKNFGKLFGKTRDNLCPLVVDTLADRLILMGWSSNSESAKGFLEEWKKKARIKAPSMLAHKHACLYGDAYVIVWPDQNNVPRLYVQNPQNIAPFYNEDGQLTAAVKAWYEPTADGKGVRLRLTLYSDKTIERYVSKGTSAAQTKPGVSPFPEGELPADTSAMVPYEDDGQPSVIVNEHSRAPIFHFSNSLSIRAFAASEMRDAVPLQLALNKALIDMLIASEFQGFRQRWATGVDIPTDPETGSKVETFKSAVDRIWTLPDNNSKFGDFDSTDLTMFIAVINDLRMEIARVTRTPAHLLMLQSGDFPSGEALKTAEAPLINKVSQRQAVWGDTWADIGAFVCEIAKVDPGTIETTWDDTTPHSEKDQAETALTKTQAGVSKPQVLRELGYTDDQITKMQEENQADRDAASKVAVAAFNSGG